MAKAKKKETEEIPPEVLVRLEELERRTKELGMLQEELLWTYTIGTELGSLNERFGTLTNGQFEETLCKV